MKETDVLIEILEKRWKQCRAEQKRCREDFSEEYVHDLRVALRRLLAALDIAQTLAPQKRTQKLRRDLKNQIDEFDDLRDTQVLLSDVSEFIHEIPALRVFKKTLQIDEKKQLRAARKYIKSLQMGGLSKRMKYIIAVLEELPQDDFVPRLFQTIDARYSTALEQYESLATASIHGLRLAFKKFRYALEIAHPLLNSFPMETLGVLHDYQAQMGEIQDMDTALLRLNDINASLSDREVIRNFYESRRAESLMKFMQNKDVLLVFWRNTSEKSFPWESQP